MWKLMQKEDGVVAVIATLIMAALFGAAALAIDAGQIYLTRSRLQSAADAAVLAGARELIMTGNDLQAEQIINRYVQSNLGETLTASVETVKETNTVSAALRKEVQFFFAPLIGIDRTVVDVSASASASSIVKMNNVVPFGVVKQDFKYGEQYVMKYGAGKDGGGSYHGNFGALSLGGNGASNYKNNIKLGYQGEVAIGDEINTEPGNMAGPTADGVSYRKGQCQNGCSFATQIEANCPRVVVTPVIDNLEVNGRKEVTVVGFAAFFLEDTYESGGKGSRYVVGRFIKWAASGTAGDGNNYGLFTVRLIK